MSRTIMPSGLRNQAWFSFTIALVVDGRYIMETNATGWRQVAMDQRAVYVPRVDFAYSNLANISILSSIAWASDATLPSRAMLLTHCYRAAAAANEKYHAESVVLKVLERLEFTPTTLTYH